MNKRYILATTLIVVVTLMTSQIVFLNSVKSDPTMHEGTAYVGELWVDELNVSSAVESFDYIGISHVEKDNDWVLWEEKEGNVVANWSLDIGSNHPEYAVFFQLYVFNLDGGNESIANSTFHKTYLEDTSYEENGSLEIYLDFDGQSLPDDITLLCYLDTSVVINNTEELSNFTSYARDRSVLGVDFEEPIGEPSFNSFVAEVNSVAPAMWSWIDGWDDSGRFDSEVDMLNTLTFCKVGAAGRSDPTGNYVTWDMGDTAVFTLQWLGHHYIPPLLDGDNEEEELNYYPDGTIEETWCKVDVKVSKERYTLRYFVFALFYFEKENSELAWDIVLPGTRCPSAISPNYVETEAWGGMLDANIDDDINEDGKISMDGTFWLFTPIPTLPRNMNHKIIIGDQESGNLNFNSETSYYWEESCAYENESYELDVDSAASLGITTVTVDIADLMEEGEPDEVIITSRGDSGDTIVVFTCE